MIESHMNPFKIKNVKFTHFRASIYKILYIKPLCCSFWHKVCPYLVYTSIGVPDKKYLGGAMKFFPNHDFLAHYG